MTDYLTLTEFVPGTKAKAQDVNANFAALKDAVNGKAAMDGDSTQIFNVANATSASHAINKGQLEGMSSDLIAEINKGGTKFCVKSGNITNGKGDLFSYSLLIVTPKIGGVYSNLVFSDYKGTQNIITSANTFSMSGKPDGTYNIFINPSSNIYTLNNAIYKQAARPSMNDGDIWFNTSVEPFSCIKYDGTKDNEFLDMPLGQVTVSSGTITSIVTFPFNQNGYNVNTYTYSVQKYNYANLISKVAGTTYTAESNGLIFIRHSNTNDTISVTIDGYSITLGWSSSQGSGSSDFIPVTKGQTYSMSGGDLHYFIPEVDV